MKIKQIKKLGNFFVKICLFQIGLCIFVKRNTKAMTHTITIKSEWERRMKLINDPIFRTMVRDGLVQMGITAEEWNDNAMYYWALIANEFCAIENAQ